MRLAIASQLVASLVAAAFLATPVASAQPAPGDARVDAPRASKAKAAKPHPDTGGDRDCARCHSTVTPAAVQAWKQGKHGEVLVTCVACHGSTGNDFTLVPANDRCTSCHAEQVATMATTSAKGRSCFTCHPAHVLNPHGTRGTATARTNEVTRTDLSKVSFPDQGIQSVPLTIQPAPPPAPAAGAAPAATEAPKPSGAPDPARNFPAAPALPGQPAQNR